MQNKKKDIVILTGPSGAGKTEMKKYLLENYSTDFQGFITSTTRPMRAGEKHGKDYYFRTNEEFLSMIFNKEVFEYEEVFTKKFYGCEYFELSRITQFQKIPLLVVDVKGALKFLGKSKNHTINLEHINPIIFYISSPIEILIKRVEKDNQIGKRNDSETDLNERFKRMGLELGLQTHFENVIINDKHPHLTGNELVNKIFSQIKNTKK